MTDLEIIGQIEKELDVKLEKADEIEWNSRGYTLNPSGQVTGLGLYECEIENLNHIIFELSALTNLTQLSFSSTQVSDISELSALTNLTQLDLRNNPIEVLPSWITDFDMEIRWKDESGNGYISFYNNPLKIPPSEIVGQGKEAVRNYFAQLKQWFGQLFKSDVGVFSA